MADYKLQQCLQVHNKDELIGLCQELMIPGYSRKKKGELAAMAAKELLNPLVMKYRLCTLPEYALELFELIGREGLDAGSFDEQKPMGKALLHETCYVYMSANNGVFIPSDVWEVYQSFSDHGWKKWRNGCYWMLECMYFANMLYGVTPMSVLGKLFRTHPDYDDGDILVEAKTVLLPAYLLNARPVEKADVFSYGLQERCLVFDAYQRPEDRNALLKQQKGKPFYIPSWTEIEELYERLYLKETPAYQRLLRFLIRVLKKDEQSAETFCRKAWASAAFGGDITADLQGLVDRLGEFPSDASIDRFFKLVVECSNETRMVVHRGHTPNEMNQGADPAALLEKDGDFRFPGPLPDELYDYAYDDYDAFPVQQPVVKPPKIYPNDPCPCGSGKKYKKCCGKRA